MDRNKQESTITEANKCPVDHTPWKHTSGTSSWFRLSKQSGASSNANPPDGSVGATGRCPMKHDGPSSSSSLSSTASMGLPASIEEHARHAQSPHPDQQIPLSTHRVVSTIPRADDLRGEEQSPAPHQPQGSSCTATGENLASKWVYPSEQQFYNAMRRKGWQGIDESTIPLVVRIHNAVNERGWSEIKRWERELHQCEEPRLVRFMGRPNHMSPKAFFNTYFLMYNPPFDRHDWYVDRGDQKPPRRYVIDFYNGNDGSSGSGRSLIASVLAQFKGGERQTRAKATQVIPRPPAMHLDVRPALDSPEAFVDRTRMFFRDAFPGLVALFAAPKTPSITQPHPMRDETPPSATNSEDTTKPHKD